MLKTKFAGWQGYRKITVPKKKKSVSWTITASGQRTLCTVSGRRQHSIFGISLFSLYHICAPAKSCYLFIFGDSGKYPFLLHLTAGSLRVNQELATMSFNLCYCILVHLCGSAFLSSNLKSFPADSDHASCFLRSLNQFLLLPNSVFSSSPTSHHTALPRCSPSAHLTAQQVLEHQPSELMGPSSALPAPPHL